MRKFFAVAAILALAISASDVAEAKKPKEAAEAAAPADPATMFEMGTTGLAPIDDFFAKAKAPIDTLVAVRVSINNMNNGVNTALGLATGTPFADALADLKNKAEGKITVAMDGEMPTLKAADGVPSNVTAAITAVNTGLKEVSTALLGLKDIPTQVQALLEESKKFIDPNTLKTIVTEAGGSVAQVPKALGTTKKNITTLTKVKDEPAALQGAVSQMYTDIKGAFGG